MYADIAIAFAIRAILKSWYEASSLHLDKMCDTSRLKTIYEQAIKSGMSIEVSDKEVLAQWQMPQRTMSLSAVWSQLIERVSSELDHKSQLALENILRHGNLSERILKACRHDYSRASLMRVYRGLGDCLLSNQHFVPV